MSIVKEIGGMTSIAEKTDSKAHIEEKTGYRANRVEIVNGKKLIVRCQ